MLQNNMSKTNVTNKCTPEKWVENYADAMYRFALSRVSDGLEAEDLVQETFFSAYKGVKGFRGDSSEKTWLFNILRNKIIDHYRKNKNKTFTSSELKHESEESNDEFFDRFFQNDGFMEGRWENTAKPGKWGQDLNDALENEEFLAILQECVKRLPQLSASVFRMKHFLEHDTNEICKELSITSSNLWVLIHRSKLQIRNCLEKNWINQ